MIILCVYYYFKSPSRSCSWKFLSTVLLYCTMFQYTRIRYYEYTTNHSSMTHVHMGSRETAAGSIYRNATMAVLYDQSQTFNPLASPLQPTATRYFLCRSSPLCLSLARPRPIVVRPIPVR